MFQADQSPTPPVPVHSGGGWSANFDDGALQRPVVVARDSVLKGTGCKCRSLRESREEVDTSAFEVAGWEPGRRQFISPRKSRDEEPAGVTDLTSIAEWMEENNFHLWPTYILDRSEGQWRLWVYGIEEHDVDRLTKLCRHGEWEQKEAAPNVWSIPQTTTEGVPLLVNASIYGTPPWQTGLEEPANA